MYVFTIRKPTFTALIHPIQWTIANPVGADRPAKHQKKTSCVSTGWPVPVLCTRQAAHGTSFLSRQRDVIASFSMGTCTVHTEFISEFKVFSFFVRLVSTLLLKVYLRILDSL